MKKPVILLSAILLLTGCYSDRKGGSTAIPSDLNNREAMGGIGQDTYAWENTGAKGDAAYASDTGGGMKGEDTYDWETATEFKGESTHDWEADTELRGEDTYDWETTTGVKGEGEYVDSKAANEAEIMDQANIELRKEELVVGKREVSNGGVLVRTVVQTDNVSQPVELRREEYVIERIPADQAMRKEAYTPNDANAFKEQEIYIPLIREEPVTSKRVVLTENVKLGKRVEMDHRTITRALRTEDVEINKNPDMSNPRLSDVPPSPAPAFSKDAGLAGDKAMGNTWNLAREEFIVGKKEVANGGVLLRKVVHTQNGSQAIDLKREEFSIERTPVKDQMFGASDFQPREFKLSLTREEPVVDTRNYVAEVIRVRKQTLTDKQLVSGTVRKENLEIIQNPNQSGQGGMGGSSQGGVTSGSESGFARDNARFSDQDISNRVRAALTKDATYDTASEWARPNQQWNLPPKPAQDFSHIIVTTQDGVVTLCGTVSSDGEKKLVADRVGMINGVKSVKNELQVAGD